MRKNQPKEKRINDVSESAVKLFIQKGYEGTSMDLIAKTSGLSKGGLYHHFRSKEQLLLAANNVYFEPIVSLMNKAIEKDSPAEGLKLFIEKYIDYWAKHQKELVFVFLSTAKILSEINLWSHINDYSEKMVEFYEFMFLKGIDNDEMKFHDAKERAVSLFSASDGVTPYLVMSKGITAQKTAKQFYSIFVEEIKK